MHVNCIHTLYIYVETYMPENLVCVCSYVTYISVDMYTMYAECTHTFKCMHVRECTYIPFCNHRPKLCPGIEFVKVGNKMKLIRRCTTGRACPYAHSKEEELYHPLVYKTEMCLSLQNCKRFFCPFAHNLGELRDGKRIDPTCTHSLPTPLLPPPSSSSADPPPLSTATDVPPLSTDVPAHDAPRGGAVGRGRQEARQEEGGRRRRSWRNPPAAAAEGGISRQWKCVGGGGDSSGCAEEEGRESWKATEDEKIEIKANENRRNNLLSLWARLVGNSGKLRTEEEVRMSRIKRRNGARERRTEVKWRKTADNVASKEEEEEEKVQSNQPSSSCWSTRQMMPRWSDAVTQFFPPCSTSSTWTPSAATALADIDGWWMSTATSNAVVPLADIDDWWTPTSSAVVAEPSTVYALGCFGEGWRDVVSMFGGNVLGGNEREGDEGKAGTAGSSGRQIFEEFESANGGRFD
eukprot:GHVS01077514.1.p1 GENE.GHVS01077514.1~~GHVS01077514.1.p1  ORF type:complete len:464 (+),score=97.12 GHVS01077514.1:20-1411(+)